jgi:hypothetical protein
VPSAKVIITDRAGQTGHTGQSIIMVKPLTGLRPFILVKPNAIACECQMDWRSAAAIQVKLTGLVNLNGQTVFWSN